LINEVLKYLYNSKFILISHCCSQEDYNQSIHLELLGNGGLYSLNYEHRLVDSLYVRIGGAYFFGIPGEFTLFPIMINYYNLNVKYSPEIGFGAVIGKFRLSAIVSESSKLDTSVF
jgi:hypothetical protein